MTENDQIMHHVELAMNALSDVTGPHIGTALAGLALIAISLHENAFMRVRPKLEAAWSRLRDASGSRNPSDPVSPAGTDKQASIDASCAEIWKALRFVEAIIGRQSVVNK